MTDLFNQFKQLAGLINPAALQQAVPAMGVAQQLMERAEVAAGRSPAEAAQLRDAARAFLSVVR